MKHQFKTFWNPVFIETGSYGGDGIMAALKAGFPKIISIELSDHYYNICKSRYKQHNVHLYHGDSAEVLPQILKKINERCTFWLDGHFCGDLSACGKSPVPLWDEIMAIKNHQIKNHTILIDDMRLLRHHEAEWKDLPYTCDDLEKLILSINPDYQISYSKGLVKYDILVAEVK